MNNNSHLADRKFIISGFFILVVLIYISRLFYIQIIDDKYKMDARNNAFRNRTEYALRGYFAAAEVLLRTAGVAEMVIDAVNKVLFGPCV